MPGKHKKSTYKMKYQGDSSAFPFKNSPMRNGGIIKTALMTGDPGYSSYHSSGIKPTGKVNIGGVVDAGGGFGKITTKVGTDTYTKTIKTDPKTKKTSVQRIERATNMQTKKPGRFLQQAFTSTPKVKKSLNFAKILKASKALDPISLAYVAAKLHQKGSHSKFPKATGEGSYKERKRNIMKTGKKSL